MTDTPYTVKAIVGQGEASREKTFVGRPAWLLRELCKAGSRGITTAELPAGIRVSHYVYELRKGQINISCEREKSGGVFGGTHGVYKLKTPVQIFSIQGGE